jgi:hypothetical protein
VSVERSFVFDAGRVVGQIGWGARKVAVVTAGDGAFSWWPAQGSLPMSVQLRHFTRTIRKGQLVGWLLVHTVKAHRYRLVARASVSPASLWQRLR